MVNLIDCTLRDGGYYTNWNFDNEFLQRIFNFHFQLDSLHFEIGYKNPLKTSSDSGLFYLTPEKYIKDVFFKDRKWPLGKKVFVMFDSKSIFEFSKSNSIDSYVESLDSMDVWNSVRIATTEDLLPFSLNFAKLLKKKGIFVAINLMRMHKIDLNLIIEILEKFPEIRNIFDVLYLADSFGSTTNEDFKKINDNLKPFLDNNSIKIGFHAHNNRGLGISNSLCAEKFGFEWIDGSWMGMGRGAGNAELEHLILDLSDNISKSFEDVKKFIPISTFKYLSNLKQKYGWGKNLEYDIASRLNIHPGFVSDLSSEKSTSSEHKINTLFSYSTIVHEKSGNDKNNLREVNSISEILLEGKNNKNNCILLFGGESSILFAKEIKKLREYYSFPIFLANFDQKLRSLYEPDLILTSSLLRFQSFINTKNNENLSILVPNEKFNLNNVNNKSFKIFVDKNRSNFNLTLEFALDIISRSNFQNIYLAGLDGSKSITNASQNENLNTFSTIKKYRKMINIQSFTYSQFSLPVKSIYSIL